MVGYNSLILPNQERFCHIFLAVPAGNKKVIPVGTPQRGNRKKSSGAAARRGDARPVQCFSPQGLRCPLVPLRAGQAAGPPRRV